MHNRNDFNEITNISYQNHINRPSGSTGAPVYQTYTSARPDIYIYILDDKNPKR